MAKAITLPTRPEDLAEVLGVKAKQLRAFLRSEFPRDKEAKGTSWELTPAMAEACKVHFAKTEDTDEV